MGMRMETWFYRRTRILLALLASGKRLSSGGAAGEAADRATKRALILWDESSRSRGTTQLPLRPGIHALVNYESRSFARLSGLIRPSDNAGTAMKAYCLKR